MKQLNIKHYFAKFRKSEHGAVTVDWVVIVAGVIGLGIAAFAVVETQTTGLATSTGEYVADRAN